MSAFPIEPQKPRYRVQTDSNGNRYSRYPSGRMRWIVYKNGCPMTKHEPNRDESGQPLSEPSQALPHEFYDWIAFGPVAGERAITGTGVGIEGERAAEEAACLLEDTTR